LRLYRVLPYLPSAADDEPGGVLFVPPGGKNRLDSRIGAYRVLYVGAAPVGCIAEAFGRFDVWDRALIESAPATPLVPGSRFALAAYDVPDHASLLDLDNAQALLDWRLRPSPIVTRDRAITQTWAAAIHSQGEHVGVQWWSYYDARWSSVGIWDIARVTPVDQPRVLHINDPDVASAARTIIRRYDTT
jgi:hypothetical protein